jgi:hypothetical protein
VVRDLIRDAFWNMPEDPSEPRTTTPVLRTPIPPPAVRSNRSLKAIVIKAPWIDLILEGKKTWEIRSRRAHPRDVIGLIRGGSGTVVGLACLKRCIGPFTADELARHFELHQVPPDRMNEVPYEQFFAWELADVRRLNPAVPYRHRSGAVIWMELDADSVGAELPRLLGEAAPQSGV